ncbi:MAG: hypothetical protein HYX75_11470 [Acidobacteria bacterium]|nr:hypothetical protein [Acidobacteriota bacterium]
MNRAVRVEFDWVPYRFRARGVARAAVYLDDEDRRSYLTIVGTLLEVGALDVHAFCGNPNHADPDPSRRMRHVKGHYVCRFNFRHKRVRALWRGRHEAILVRDAGYLHECPRYIHLNPKRARIMRTADRY